MYAIDENRYVKVLGKKGKLVYLEGTSTKPAISGVGASKTYGSEIEVSSVKLSEGWKISLKKPNIVCIQMVVKTPIVRQFGELEVTQAQTANTITRKSLPKK